MDLIILTLDSDYGELIFKNTISDPPAVVYFRDKGSDPLFAGRLLIRLLSKDEISLFNSFTVVEEKNIRQRVYKK